MNNQDRHNLCESYSKVSHKTDMAINEWSPVNRATNWARKFATGKSDIPGSGLVGAITRNVPGLRQWSDQQAGKIEHGDESNILWRDFNRDVLAHATAGKIDGATLKGWFRKTARYPVDHIAALQTVQDAQVYDVQAIRKMFPDIVRDGLLYMRTGGAQKGPSVIDDPSPEPGPDGGGGEPGPEPENLANCSPEGKGDQSYSHCWADEWEKIVRSNPAWGRREVVRMLNKAVRDHDAGLKTGVPHFGTALRNWISSDKGVRILDRSSTQVNEAYSDELLQLIYKSIEAAGPNVREKQLIASLNQIAGNPRKYKKFAGGLIAWAKASHTNRYLAKPLPGDRPAESTKLSGGKWFDSVDRS